MASIEELKGAVSAGKGIASASQYLVQLPAIPGSSLSGSARNTLCRVARLPGRQILTYDRQVGIMQQKIGYGYANADVGLSFHVLNDYKTKKYFDLWQNLIVDQATQQISYADKYRHSVFIYQLQKGKSFQIFDRNFSIFGLDLNVDIELSSAANAVYGIELEKAFPVTMNGIDLTDASADTTVEISIDLSYQNWKQIK
tara:strand:+ start:5372 stop:5968 length:597 start_codon:yes stop_codon:yes gene_type:complete